MNKKIIYSAVVVVILIVAALFVYAFNTGYLSKLPVVGNYFAQNENKVANIQVPPFDKNIKEVKVYTIKQGAGRAIKKGEIAYVFYAAVLPNGQVFDTNQGKNPVGFPVGEGTLIKGLDQVLPGVKEGSEIVVDVPSHLAYGKKGVTIQDKEIVPPNTPLRFDILVVKVMSKDELKQLQEQLKKQLQEQAKKGDNKQKSDNKNNNSNNEN